MSSPQSSQAKPATLASMFQLFAKYRPALNTFQGDGKRILLSQSDCWMQQASLIGSKYFTLTQTGLTFFEFRKSSLDFAEYLQFLAMLCTEKANVELEEVKEKLTNCGPPGINT
ncbi:tubulin polymerization-promoting protein homolog [Anopheles cruzii]|uniref:tubulin polymerization-promoting protein homolog n=1 Tax=Anopheles cruzii TaxID=68878 RepID=UPI0022EC3580|nr:tubulin polymerization-promoting protein homolog [Anopheles cruzii]